MQFNEIVLYVKNGHIVERAVLRQLLLCNSVYIVVVLGPPLTLLFITLHECVYIRKTIYSYLLIECVKQDNNFFLTTFLCLSSVCFKTHKKHMLI